MGQMYYINLKIKLSQKQDFDVLYFTFRKTVNKTERNS